MADETVASLGFEVNSKPLDDAKQKLAEVSTEAGKTGKAVDDFNAKVGNTGAAASKAADGVGKVGPAFGAIESAANRAGVSVETMRSRAAAFSAETAKLATSSVAAGSAIGTIAKEAGAIAPALGAVGAATSAVVKEHEAHNAALSSLRGNLRGMSPLLNQLGGGLGDVLQYARAARLGLEGLALVAGGGLLIALAKVGDEVDRTKNRLSGLTGSAAGGAKAYDAIAAAAKATGIEFATIEGAVEKAIIGQEQLADKNVQYANTAEMVAKKTVETTAAFRTFGTMLQANVATSAQAKTALNVLGDSFEKTGKLTVDAFVKIRDASPGTAKAIADAFGYKNVSDFIRELDRAPISLDQFKRRMAEVAPQVAKTFDPEKPKNFTQALDGLSRKWNDFVKDLAKKPEAIGAIDVLKEALQVLPKILEQDFKDIAGFKNLFTAAGAEWDAYKEKVSNAWHNTEAAVQTAIENIIAIVGKLPSEGIAAITSWANSAIAEFNRMAQGAVSAAQQAVSALGSIAKGGGGNIAGLSGGGNPGSTDALGNPMGGTGGASDGLEGVQLSPQGNDAGAPGFDLGLADLPAFASGGQFTVAGSGGTDSQVVSFKSTPGEVVTVSTPEQIALQSTGAISGVTTQTDSSAVGVVSATPEPAAVASVKEITDAIDKSSIDITKKMLLGSDAIVTELKKLTGGVAASTVNPATGLPIATTGNMLKTATGTGTSKAGGSGGGGFTVKGLNKDYSAEMAAQQKEFDQANAGAQGGGSYYPGGGQVSYSRGGSVKGGFFSDPYGTQYRPFRTMAPTGQFAAAQNPNYNPADYNSGYSTGAYGGDPYASDAYGPMAPYDSGSSFYGTDSGGSSNISGSLSGYDSGSSSFYGTDSGGSGTISGSFSDIGTTQVPSGSGGVYGFDGNVDPNAINYGGGSVNAGYFATGGSFTVPGSSGGGIDKTVVTMHATPGETVTVTPLSPNFATAANADPSSQANITNKTVNIHVQAGIQAESFIRSRAMIARGL